MKRKNRILQSENDLIRKELRAMKDLKKKELNSSRLSMIKDENEIERLTKDNSKLLRFKQDVSHLFQTQFNQNIGLERQIYHH